MAVSSHGHSGTKQLYRPQAVRARGGVRVRAYNKKEQQAARFNFLLRGCAVAVGDAPLQSEAPQGRWKISRQRAKLGVPSTLSAEACLVVGGGWWDDQNAQSVVNAPPI